jgi:hypothetical protein
MSVILHSGAVHAVGEVEPTFLPFS